MAFELMAEIAKHSAGLLRDGRIRAPAQPFVVVTRLDGDSLDFARSAPCEAVLAHCETASLELAMQIFERMAELAKPVPVCRGTVGPGLAASVFELSAELAQDSVSLLRDGHSPRWPSS